MKPVACQNCGKPIERNRRGRTLFCAPCTWAAREAKQEILKRPQPCRRQVYSSLSVAESTVSAMLRMGFLKEARVEKCLRCGLIHVREVRHAGESASLPLPSRR
jgi:hypothetical protein